MDSFASFMAMAASLGITPEDIRRTNGEPREIERLMRVPRSAGSSSAPATGQYIEHDQYMRMIDEAKRNFERERRLPPGPVPPLERHSFLQQFFSTRAFASELDNREAQIRTTYVGMEKHSSRTPIDNLTRIPVSKMQVRLLHTGRYLLCRIISPAVRLVAVQFAVEDPAGGLQQLSLYNYPGTFEAANPLLDALFPLGATLIVREPALKMMAIGTKAHIRIDTPSDISFVRPNDPLLNGVTWRTGTRVPQSKPPPSTVPAYKALGDRYFKNGLFLPAALAYSDGLHIDSTAHLLRLNRAMTYLRLEYWSAALSDSDIVLSMDDLPQDQRIKALYRAGQAEYNLQLWKSAKARYEEILSLDSSQDTCREALSRTETRILEATNAEYDWVNMYKSARKAAARIDVADFIGPVEVSNIPSRGGGRGIKASRDIKAGELLVVSKPFGCVFPEDLSPKEVIVTLNMITSTVDSKCQAALQSKVCEKLASDPSFARPVYDLYAGNNAEPPPSTYSALPDPNVPPIQQPLNFSHDLDVARIEGVLSHNVFLPSMLSSGEQPGVRASKQDTDSPAALYFLPSLFNHACNGNAIWHCYGDVMVVRASKDTKAGTELLVKYGGDGSVYKRQKAMAKWLPQCDCSLCKADRNDGRAACEKRDRLFEGSAKDWAQQGQRPPNISTLKTRLREIQATYRPERKEIRPELFPTLGLLAVALQLNHKVPESFSYRFEALECFGIVVLDKSIKSGGNSKSSKLDRQSLPIATTGIPQHDGATGCAGLCLIIAGTFMTLSDEVRAERWVRAARWIEGILTGGSPEIFKLRYKPEIEMTGLPSKFFL